MPPQPRQFWQQLSYELLSSCYQCLVDNTDTWRFPNHPWLRKVRDRLVNIAAACGFPKPRDADYINRLQGVMDAGCFDNVMQLLEDDASRDILVKVMAFRILGSRHYRLPMNTPAFWQARSKISRYLKTPNVVRGIPVAGSLDEYDCEGIRLIAHAGNIFESFVMEHYHCRRAGIKVRKGDVVIDGGACWGDASLYFARQAEHVFAYECVPSNFAIFKRNMDLNPGLASRITLIPKALWETSGATLFFSENGPGSSAQEKATGLQVETQSIDDLAEERKLSHVDFIKMDIEGAETKALLGAEQTIRRHRPRLAISVYHNIKDYIRIPQWIADLDLGYRMYLDHFTIHGEESVLFACSNGDGSHSECQP
jgi:FkbM family methyltransferase